MPAGRGLARYLGQTSRASLRLNARLAIWLAGIAFLAGCRGSVEYLNFDGYRGDAKVWERRQDNSYPKYWVLFPEIPIDKTADYVFHVSGLTRSGYWFGLAAGPAGDETGSKSIRDHELRCDVEIDGRLEEFPIHLGGMLGTNTPAESHHWWLHEWWSRDNFWIQGVQRRIYCSDEMGVSRVFRPDPNVEYEIRIRVTARENLPWSSGLGRPTLTPVLWAGGERAGFLATR